MQRADLQYRGDGPARRNRTHDASLAPGRTVTATENSRTTGDFEGVETRKLSYNLDGGDTTWTVNGPIFYGDDVVVNALVASDGAADSESADRFLSSLKSQPEPDRAA